VEQIFLSKGINNYTMGTNNYTLGTKRKDEERDCRVEQNYRLCGTNNYTLGTKINDIGTKL
jgi:hypothetical protein